ncbi:MAG TPA: universal stress protein [Vicinamibacterales bacterium]|nr:universal stress protein [Vicinamibacterales bacterium]
MLMLRSVLCPVDFSDQSLHALRWAVALAAQNQSRLIVLTAIEPLLAEAARARLGLDLAKADTQACTARIREGGVARSGGVDT